MKVSSDTAAPAMKMSELGVKSSPTTPTPMTPDDALTIDPIHGPTSMGTSTTLKMRIPCVRPTWSGGVALRMAAEKHAT